MSFDAFISYAHQDKAAADAACAKLEAEGIRCWIAPRDVPPGAQWAAAIVDAIDHCRAMVVIFSSNANASKQIHREVQRAFEREVPVVPFRIENVAPEKSLAYYMGPVHWLDALTPPLEQHLQKLVVSLKPFAQINVLGEKDNEERSPRDAEADKSAEIDRLRPPEPNTPRQTSRRALLTLCVIGVVLIGSVGIWFGYTHWRPVSSRPQPARSSSPPTPPTDSNVDASHAQNLQNECKQFAGDWQTTSDLTPMHIVQTGCVLSGSFASSTGAYRHTFIGNANSNNASLIINRIDGNKCQTNLNTVISYNANGELVFRVFGTSGLCGLSAGYQETRIWQRMPSNNVTLQTGLMGYWPLDGNTTNWTTNTTQDVSGNGSTGMLVNMSMNTSPVPGKIDGALAFNGTSQYVIVTNLNPETSLSGNYTVSAWLLSTAATADNWRPFIGDMSGGAFYIGSSRGFNNRLNVNLNGVAQDISGSYILNDNKWHRVDVVVVPSKSITVYFDGPQIFQGLTPSSQGTTAIAIGHTQRSEYWKGYIDDVRIYNRALSAQELTQLYSMGQ